MMNNRPLFILLVLLWMPGVSADTGSQLLNLVEQKNWLDDLAPELKVLFTLSLMSLIPALFIAMTAFTRIVIVLSMLRQALGLMQTPPNIVIIVLAFFLTWFTMSPFVEQSKDQALVPYLKEEISLSEALENGVKPFREFMISQTREEDFSVILELADKPIPDTESEVKLVHLVPAFLLSELRTAFQIAFVIFIPFLVVDLIVASTLMALGMIMVPPITIALPVKVMLFVLIDGWALVTQSLLGSFVG